MYGKILKSYALAFRKLSVQSAAHMARRVYACAPDLESAHDDRTHLGIEYAPLASHGKTKLVQQPFGILPSLASLCLGSEQHQDVVHVPEIPHHPDTTLKLVVYRD